MKRAIVGLLLVGSMTTALAIDKVELEQRIRTLTARFESLQQRPDKRIPAETLREAKGIVLLDRTKAAFIFAYQGGSGVAMARNAGSDKWGPTAFLSANEGSLGFQIGGQQSFVVILLMDTNSTRLLTEPNIQFGGEARGTAGDSSAGAEGNIAPQEPSVRVYSDRKGLYGGAAIKGGAIAPDERANRVYYGQALTLEDILFENKVKPTEAALDLAAKIDDHSQPDKKPTLHRNE
jgi:lipid-binding SYLF domain-containing protein